MFKSNSNLGGYGRTRHVTEPETLDQVKGVDFIRSTKMRCFYCLDRTDEPLGVQGLGMRVRVCLKCKEKRGIKVD